MKYQRVVLGFCGLLSLPIFFILHGYNENIGLIPATIFGQLFLKYSLIAIIIYALSWLVFKKFRKALVFSIFLLCIYFFFGAFHDGMKSIFGNSFLSSYSFLLPFLFVLCALVFYWIRKNHKDFQVLSKYYSYLISAFLVLEVVFLFINIANNKASAFNLTVPEKNTKLIDACPEVQEPDIFFIILDGYTSSEYLQKYFEFDNAATDSLLRANHFFLVPFSRSNYNITPFSLSATLNMSYLRPGLDDGVISSKTFLQAMATLKTVSVVKFLQEQHYEIKNFGCFDLDAAKTTVTPYFSYYQVAQIDDQTFY